MISSYGFLQKVALYIIMSFNEYMIFNQNK